MFKEHLQVPNEEGRVGGGGGGWMELCEIGERFGGNGLRQCRFRKLMVGT